MPNPANTGETPAEATTTGGTAASNGTVTATSVTIPPAVGTTVTTTEEPYDKDRAMALIAKLREEVRTATAEAKEGKTAKERLAEIERAQLTEQERLQAERDEAIERTNRLEATNRANAIKLAVYGKQAEMGVADADLALAAIDHTKIQFDEAGQPTNIGDLLTDLLERKPLLRATPAPPRVPSTDGGSGGGPTPDLTADELEAARLTGMTPERYAAVKAAMGGQRTVSVTDAAAALLK